MSNRYVVVGADRAGNSWDILVTDNLSEAFDRAEERYDAQGVWDLSRDRWVYEDEQ